MVSFGDEALDPAIVLIVQPPAKAVEIRAEIAGSVSSKQEDDAVLAVENLLEDLRHSCGPRNVKVREKSLEGGGGSGGSFSSARASSS